MHKIRNLFKQNSEHVTLKHDRFYYNFFSISSYVHSIFNKVMKRITKWPLYILFIERIDIFSSLEANNSGALFSFVVDTLVHANCFDWMNSRNFFDHMHNSFEYAILVDM